MADLYKKLSLETIEEALEEVLKYSKKSHNSMNNQIRANFDEDFWREELSRDWAGEKISKIATVQGTTTSTRYHPCAETLKVSSYKDFGVNKKENIKDVIYNR